MQNLDGCGIAWEGKHYFQMTEGNLAIEIVKIALQNDFEIASKNEGFLSDLVGES